MNAPLLADPADPEPRAVAKDANVKAAVDTMINLGVPKSKINAGLPFYGKGYAGVPHTDHGLFQTYSGPSQIGTWAPGYFDFWDLKQNYMNKPNSPFEQHWDAAS